MGLADIVQMNKCKALEVFERSECKRPKKIFS